MTDARAVYRHHPTQSEIDAVLAKRLVATIGTVNEDGSVHLAYVIFAFADGRFLVETSSVTRKARNVAARGRATILVQGAGPEGRNLPRMGPIDDVAIEVTPVRWRSWTGSLLHAAAIEQLGDRYEEIWLDDE